MPLVSITRLRVRSFRYLPVFLFTSLRSARQAKKAPGSLAVALLPDANFTYWTRTVWSDEHAMRSFMVASPHRRAMLGLRTWCDEASLVHWLQDPIEPPSWPEAHQRLQRDGRISRVDHPSAAQQRFEIPPPRTTRQLTLK